MIGTINCVYETPCGWCSKWDKKCDMKLPARGQRAKCNPIDDAITNIVCQSESDHEWECTGISTGGTTYTCKKCYAHKTYPAKLSDELEIRF